MKKMIDKIKNDKIIRLVNEHKKNHAPNAEVYAVGGVCRDFYLGCENFDKDIVITGYDAKIFAQTLANSIEATFVELDDENRIYRIVLNDKINFIDVAAAAENDIKKDLKRRDLTVNSLAVNLQTFEELDVCGALYDLENKIIRQISEQNFIDDPLRLLRAHRFQSTLGFKLDEQTKNSVKKHAAKIHNCARERINYELLKLFGGAFAAKTLTDMDETGLIRELFGFCDDLKKVPPNLHHHLGLFEHSIETVHQLQNIYEKAGKEVIQHLDNQDFGAATRIAHLKFSAFLHDIGKPQTWTIEEETQKHRFIKHDDVGAKMATPILKELKCSKKQIEYITKMIKYHIYPSHVVSAPDLTEKIYMRFIRKMENDSIDIILLAMADRLSARGVEITEAVVKKNISALQSLLDFYLQIRDGLKPLPKLLSGDEIMDLLDIKPSKELGIIIDSLKEAQLNGEITTKEQAVNYILSLKN